MIPKHEIYAMHMAEAKRLFTDDQLIEMYTDFFNNYLTIKVFSEHYQIPTVIGEQVLNRGRELRSERAYNKRKV